MLLHNNFQEDAAEVLQYSFELKPQTFEEFDPAMLFIMTSPASFLTKLPIIFRHIEKPMDSNQGQDTEDQDGNQPDCIIIWGRTVAKANAKSSKIETCSNYDVVNEEILKYFPNLSCLEVNKALERCRQFDVVPYRD